MLHDFVITSGRYSWGHLNVLYRHGYYYRWLQSHGQGKIVSAQSVQVSLRNHALECRSALQYRSSYQLYSTCVLCNIGTVVGNWMENTSFTFNNKECADMHYVCGFCNWNAAAGIGEYRRRFPRQRIPSRRMYSSRHRQLWERGTFSTLCRDPNVLWGETWMTKTLVEWCIAVQIPVSNELLPSLVFSTESVADKLGRSLSMSSPANSAPRSLQTWVGCCNISTESQTPTVIDTS
jgi:hypothetical protein